jgi:hypothetical protein
MLVVLGMTRALLGAGSARRPARLQHGSKERGIPRSLPGGDAARSDADVRAVQAETDAAGHLCNVGLGQVGVRADRAGGGALHARLDTARGRAEIPNGPWMGFEQLLGVHRVSSRPFRLLELPTICLVAPGSTAGTILSATESDSEELTALYSAEHALSEPAGSGCGPGGRGVRVPSLTPHESPASATVRTAHRKIR